MVFSCEVCSNNRVPFVALDIATIFNHYGRYHRHDPNFFVTCKVPGCGASYRKLEGFRSHIRRHHKDVYMPNGFADEIIDIHVDQNYDNIIEDANEPQNQPEVDFRKQNALFLLKSKEIHQLSEEATKTLLSDTTSLIQRSVEQVRDKVNDCLNNAGKQLDDIVGLKEIFSPENAITNPFTGLKTKTEQKDYFKDQFGLEPIRIVLGHHHTSVRSGTKRKSVAKPEEMVLVPLLKSLEAMLNDQSVMKEIDQSHVNI